LIVPGFPLRRGIKGEEDHKILRHEDSRQETKDLIVPDFPLRRGIKGEVDNKILRHQDFRISSNS
jgi:hypothetical protein